jgi:hypothetical protein
MVADARNVAFRETNLSLGTNYDAVKFAKIGMHHYGAARTGPEESMSKRQAFLNERIACVAATGLLLYLAASALMAQNGGGDYLFLIAAGFLCDSGESTACPAVVRSADYATYELSGAGTFNSQSKTVTATGTFRRKSPDGSSLETGIWVANDLGSFNSYGAAPDLRMREAHVFGGGRLGPRGMSMLSGLMPVGGLAVFRVRLLPMSGPMRTAVLEVNCALGKAPLERQTEGIRLRFEGAGAEYDQEIGGHTMFLMMRP